MSVRPASLPRAVLDWAVSLRKEFQNVSPPTEFHAISNRMEN
jgi:hypothetical protein